MKFNWDKFKNENIAVHCDTEEKAKEFVSECHKRGMKWCSSSKSKTYWCCYAQRTCYSYDFNNCGSIQYANKEFYEREGCEIIKWESEEDMKFKVGDKVVKANGNRWSNGDKDKTITKCFELYGESRYELNNDGGYWTDGELKLYKEPQTEFTFQEVVARIKEREVYVPTLSILDIKSISLKDGCMVLEKTDKNSNLRIGIDRTFKLQESKKHTWIYKVEHQKNGKHYDFISSQSLQDDEFVVCDTCKGESYGRVAEIISKELTEEEIKQYKECWRA